MHRYIKRGLKYFALAASAMLLVLCAVLFYLLSTTSGLRTLISASNTYFGDTVEITGDIKSGSVLNGFETSSPLCVDVKDVVQVKADSFKIGYSVLGYLVTDLFEVDRIDADKLEVILTYKDSDDKNDEAQTVSEGSDGIDFKLNFPVRINVEDLILKDFAYLSDVVDVRVKSASLKLTAFKETAQILYGHTDDVDVHLKYESEDDVSEEANTVRSFDDGNGQISKLYTVNLPLTAVISKLAINRGRYHMSCYDTGVFYAYVDAHWKDTLLTVNSVRASHNLGSVSVKGTMDFTDFYSMDFDIEGNGHPNYYNLTHYDGALYSLCGKGKLYGSLVDLNLSTHLSNPSVVDVHARLNTLSDLLPASLSVDSNLISYPFNDKLFARNPKLHFKDRDVNSIYEYYLAVQKELSPKLKEDRFTSSRSSLSKVKLNLNGHILDNMKVDFSAVLNGFGFKNLSVAVNSDTTLTGSQINSLTLKGISGSHDFNGSVSGFVTYDEVLSFDGKAYMRSDDISGITDFLEGKFFCDAKGLYSYNRTNGDYIIHIDDLASEFSLLDQKSSLELKQFSLSSVEPFSLDYLSFVQSQNNVNLKSSKHDNNLLEGNFDLKDLSSLYAGIEGSAVGRFTVTGDREKPKVVVVGKSDRLRFKDAVLSKVVLDFNLDMSKKTFSNTLIADNLRLPKVRRNYSSCSLDAGGSLSDHTLVLSCGADDGSFVAAQGSYDPDTSVYKADISNLVIVSNIVNPIYLEHPVLFEYNTQEKEGFFTEVKLTDGKASLNLTKGSFAYGVFETAFKVERLNLNLFTRFMPENTSLKGVLSGEGSYRYEGGISYVKSEMNAKGGVFKYQKVVLPYDTASLALNSNEQSFDSVFSVNLAHNLGVFKIDSSLRDIQSGKKLSGSVDLTDFNLALLSSVSPSVNTVYGKANLHGTLGGTLLHPLLFGKADVEGEINPTVNIGYIDKFSIRLDANGDNGTVDGTVSLNQSSAHIKGNLNWADRPSGVLNLAAKDLPVFLMGKGEAYTDINAKASFADSISLFGDVYVKKAKIKFNSLDSGSVAPSGDEIYVRKNNNLYTEVNKKIKLNKASAGDVISVNVRLSDDIKVDSMGVKGNLTGAVSINKEAGSQKLSSSGKISLENGRAQLYGHKFIVNRANSLFKDDIDNPLLDAEVICDPSYVEDSVVAGVKITGRAKDPSIRLFSNPAMSQNEILSYILYGHGLEKTSDNNTDRSSTQFLTSLGLGTTSGLLNAFVGVFGMDGVQIGSSGSGNDSQVEVQTYITNKVRLSYGYGIFNSVQEFKLRYEIMSRLYAEVASSIGASIDLIYSFDSD